MRGNHFKAERDKAALTKYFITNSCPPGYQPLLLPDEYCLAEDEGAAFDLHVDRVGFHLLGSDAWFPNIRAKIYLTNYRLIFIPVAKGKSKYSPFSICIEAIRKPRLSTIGFSSANCLEFKLCLDHGASAIRNQPEKSRTVGDLFVELFHKRPFDPRDYKSCEVICNLSSEFHFELFLKGIELCILKGVSCPTRTCRFIEYEDLPLYSDAVELTGNKYVTDDVSVKI
jgi:hypothetical protein